MPESTSDYKRLILKHLHLQGYKSIEDLKVELKDGLNVLIGKNGAGKSNFLDCVNQVTRLLYRNVPNLPCRYVKINLLASDNNFFTIELTRLSQKHAHSIDRESSNALINKRFFINDDLIYDNSNQDDVLAHIHFDNSEYDFKGNMGILLQRMQYIPFYPLNIEFSIPHQIDCVNVPGILKIPFDVTEIWDVPESFLFIVHLFYDLMSSDFGEKISKTKSLIKSSLLKQLKLSPNILNNLNVYSPIQDVRFNQNINIYTDDKMFIVENLKLDFKVNNTWMPWSQLSDGTKRLFYLISEISNKENGLILIEEPELGIHPHQFNLLMTFLKEQSQEKQIILSTHSPKALDHLSEDELDNILVASYTKKSGTQIKHLSAAQKKKATAYMKEVGFLSDYWTLSDLE